MKSCSIIGMVCQFDSHSVASFLCTEHNMPIQGPVDANSLCPIGRIERAAEEAIKRIAAAVPMPAEPVPPEWQEPFNT